MDNRKYKDIDEYISEFPQEIQAKLEIIRKTIHDAAPQATEKISYQMPAFDFHGVLVYFAAFKNHIGFFPTGSGIEAFTQEISDYKTSKGTIQLPLDKPLPVDLITRIVKFRLEENQKKVEAKKGK